MAVFPTYYKPVYPAEKIVSPNVRNVSFQRGGVYGREERAVFGINPNPATWNITFVQRIAEVAEIYNFLLSHKLSRESFTWTAPDSSIPKYWKCDQFSKEIFDYNAARVTATFVECFEPPKNTLWSAEGVAISQAAPVATLTRSGGSVATDPYFSQVSLLLHMNGDNGSTTFADSSSNAHSMYVNDGTVTITTADSKFGGSSADFTAGGDLRTPSSATFTFTGDFTIEFWAKRTGRLNGLATLLSAEWKPGNDQWLMIRPKEVYDGEAFWINDQGFAYNFALTPDTWQHLAMVRNGSIVTAYVDGSSIGTVTESGTVTSGYLVFGDSSAASGRYFKGLIDEVRVTKGVARYTSNFTPPTEPFPNS